MKKLFLSATALFLAFSVGAQDVDSPVQTQKQTQTSTPTDQSRTERYDLETLSPNRWGVGGSFGLSFGRRSFGFQVSPQFVYWIHEDLTVGGGMSYSYYRFRGTNRYTLNYFGINGSVHYYFFRNIFVFAQPEVWRRWGQLNNASVGKEVFTALPLGAGFRVPTNDGEMQLSFYYDVIQNNYSPHGSGLGVSIGYIFRF